MNKVAKYLFDKAREIVSRYTLKFVRENLGTSSEALAYVADDLRELQADLLDYKAQLALTEDLLNRDLETDADFNRYCIRLNPLHELSYTKETIKELETLSDKLKRLEHDAVERNKGELRRANERAKELSQTLMRKEKYGDTTRSISNSARWARRLSREADRYRKRIVKLDSKEEDLQHQIRKMISELNQIEQFLKSRREDIVTVRKECMDWKWHRVRNHLY